MMQRGKLRRGNAGYVHSRSGIWVPAFAGTTGVINGNAPTYCIVITGLVPGIHVLAMRLRKDVDGRDEPGHDDLVGALLNSNWRRY